jgi:hypothetical protein
MLKRHKCRFVESMSSHVESMLNCVKPMSAAPLSRIESTMGQWHERTLPYGHKINKEKID